MPRIRYVNDEGETVEEEVLSRRVTFFEGTPDTDTEADGVGIFNEVTASDDIGEFRPAVPQRVEFDHEGDVSSVTTVCGETENRRESDQKPRIIVEGLVVEEQIPQIRQIQRAEQLTLISDLFQGEVEVKRVTIEQNTDRIEFIPDGGQAELAFPFQLQLRQP